MQPPQTSPCPACGHENELDWLFCSVCGIALRRVCAECGQENPDDATFCVRCGRELNAPPEAPEAAAAPTSTTCPRCGHYNEPSTQFCVNCGLPFEGENAPRQFITDPTIGPTGTPYQGFWIRVGALFIDVIALYFLVVLPVFLVAIAASGAMAFGLGSDSTADAILGLLYIASLVATTGLYYTIPVGWFGATPGKYLVGVSIVRQDGGPVSYGRALTRYLGFLVSLVFLGLPIIGWVVLLMVAFRQDKRALHDLIAGTVVVKRSSRM